MKRLLLSMLSVCLCVLGSAQAYEGGVEYQKKIQPAAVIELAYPPALVSAAMNDYLSKKGKSRKDDVKGFITFRNTEAVSTDSMNADLYFKTERKSRKEKEITVLSLLVMPTDDQAKIPNLHFLSMGEAKIYLDELALAIEAYNLELAIKEQNEAIIKAENKHRDLVNEGLDLDKKRAAIEKKIADNRNDQQQQVKEIESHKQKLTQWVSQRKY